MSGSFPGLPGSLPEPDESHRLPAQPPPAGVWIDWGPPLPESYAQDRLRLLVRDPWCLFAYWELTGEHAHRVPERHGPDVFAVAAWRLRLFAGEALVQEIAACAPLGSAYFAVEPERSYRAELGLLKPDGTWIVVARDGEVLTPRATVSGATDVDWDVSEEELMRLLGLSAEEARARAELLRRGVPPGYAGARPGAAPSSGGAPSSR